MNHIKESEKVAKYIMIVVIITALRSMIFPSIIFKGSSKEQLVHQKFLMSEKGNVDDSLFF